MGSVSETVRGQRRAELAAFLRSRRALVTPDDAGLATGPRRRTPGLRRVEVAQLAGVGVTWYTWLEQGRPINVSPQVLDAVASVLRLDRAEHNHLYRLADMPEVPAPPSNDALLSPNIRAVLDGFTDLPACVYNGKFDLLAWNDSFAALFPSLTGDGIDRNALWYTFTYRGSENPLGSDECLAHMVATVRSAYARHIGEPAWVNWVARMSTASQLFESMWASNRVSTPMPLERELSCAFNSTFHARMTSFAITGAPESHMIVYIPVANEDVDLLAGLRQARATASTPPSSPLAESP